MSRFKHYLGKMKTPWKWIVVEFATIVVGTYTAVYSLVDSRRNEMEVALGASLFVLGVMIRLWRKEFFRSPSAPGPKNKPKKRRPE